jgi:uncharacterized membrane protein
LHLVFHWWGRVLRLRAGNGRFTVFVPSVPTPFAGAVYILTPDRVHPLDVAFTQAVQAVSRWGSGTKDLVAAMKPEHTMPKAQG